MFNSSRPLHPLRPRSAMQHVSRQETSPLMLCDHLITLAQEADRAGYPGTAGHLVALVDRMFEEHRPHH